MQKNKICERQWKNEIKKFEDKRENINEKKTFNIRTEHRLNVNLFIQI